MNLIRRRRPIPVMARRNPLYQAHADLSLPFWVATDHAIWAAVSTMVEAVTLADKVARIEPVGERVVVSHHLTTVYRTTGHNREARFATRP